MIPAIRSVLLNAPRERRSHAGLILGRYLREAGKGSETAKQEAIAGAMEAVKDQGCLAVYNAALQRWKSSLSPGTRLLTFSSPTTSSRIIVGLGGDNAMGAGLTLHHTYGVPYLPGSALKGLAAHYAHAVWGAADRTWSSGGDRHRTMFGSSAGDDPAGGLIDFLDGWIADPKESLLQDVITPHHGSYYMAENPVPEPTDFDTPVPVPFIAVKGTFWVAIYKRDKRLPDAWLDQAGRVLQEALEEWGIGGKTNADYGRLKLDSVTLVSDAAAATNETLPETPALEKGTRHEAELTGKSGSGKWKARLLSGQGTGTITNSDQIPRPEAKVKQRVQVVITQAANPNNLQFEYVPKRG